MMPFRARAICGWAVCAALVVGASPPPVRAADPSPPPSAAPGPTAAPPIALADVATKADEVGLFLQQLDERLASGPAIEAITAALPAAVQEIADRAGATQRALAANPGLREIDALTGSWRTLRDQLNDWTATVTGRVNELEREIGGLDELRAIWRATRDQAKAENAPAEVVERTDTALAAIVAARKGIESRRKALR